jgi:NAD(P)-dependent dehydrogenase (short-subunit alcohol dehydrogenase family)
MRSPRTLLSIVAVVILVFGIFALLKISSGGKQEPAKELSTMPQDGVSNFGKQVPMKRPGQPAELATTYVMLADPLSSYVSGATIAVTGGKPIL